jgi:hypothetical protein
MDELVREKDAIIKQVMEEGEALSKKQLSQEQTIKRLRGQAKELQAQVGAGWLGGWVVRRCWARSWQADALLVPAGSARSMLLSVHG